MYKIFYFFGAALILPFAGIELMILFIAFYLSFRWSSKKEKIYISQEIVKIEKGINKAEYLWEEFRTFTSFSPVRVVLFVSGNVRVNLVTFCFVSKNATISSISAFSLVLKVKV